MNKDCQESVFQPDHYHLYKLHFRNIFIYLQLFLENNLVDKQQATNKLQVRRDFK